MTKDLYDSFRDELADLLLELFDDDDDDLEGFLELRRRDLETLLARRVDCFLVLVTIHFSGRVVSIIERLYFIASEMRLSISLCHVVVG